MIGLQEKLILEKKMQSMNLEQLKKIENLYGKYEKPSRKALRELITLALTSLNRPLLEEEIFKAVEFLVAGIIIEIDFREGFLKRNKLSNGEYEYQLNEKGMKRLKEMEKSHAKD